MLVTCLYVLFYIYNILIILDINPEHYKKASIVIRYAISKIATGSEDRFTPELAVLVLTKLMNTVIVNIMSGQLHGTVVLNNFVTHKYIVASIKCLQGYCYFQRLLLHFAKEYPSILSSANKQVNDFIVNESLRHKKVKFTFLSNKTLTYIFRLSQP
jgi:hypothetical protein